MFKLKKDIRLMKIISFIIIFILVIFGISFALLNASVVTLNYYFGSIKMSLSLLLVFTLGLGVLIAFLIALWSILKNKNQNRRLKNRIKQLELEIEKLKNVTIEQGKAEL